VRAEFNFDAIGSVEFCVSVRERDDQDVHANYLIPTDQNVQDALRDMLSATVRQFDALAADAAEPPFELSEKYAAREALVADLASDEMSTLRALHEEEGWPPRSVALREPADIAYYFAVFRDDRQRKLLGVRRAAQFKGVFKSRLIQLMDDSLTLVGDHVFKLDNEFDFLIAPQHVYILHPASVEHIAKIEELVAAKARDRALALAGVVKFADFGRIAEFVLHHKRAARLVVSLGSRPDLGRIRKSKFIALAADTDVAIEKGGKKIRPAVGAEIGFLELLDARRYTLTIKTGPKEAFVASSRRPLPS